MFEHIQARKRQNLIVPMLAIGAICIVTYVVIDRWSRSSSERETAELFNSFSAPSTFSGPSGPRDFPLEHVDLPGMSLSLPGQPITNGDYIAGSANSGTVGVGWTAGTLVMDPAFEQQQFKSFGAGQQPVTATRFANRPAFEDHVGDGLHVLAGSCGRRVVIIQAHTSRQQFDEIKSSVRCKPEHELRHLGVIVAARKGWSRKHDDPNIHLESSTGDIVTLHQRSGEFEPTGVYGIPAGARSELRGGYRIWRGKGMGLDDKPRLTAIVDWKCPGQSFNGEALIVAKTSLDESIELALTGSCIALDAPLPAHLLPPRSS